ncbi:hypothetical protein OPIT5_16640 [Opitutaceae bacterium TAV5]|nr:hypothetical protein OPIT5_16640 [Opitutaceae bacterium TAV5]
MNLRNAYEYLLAELESSCLEVVLVPQRIRTNEGGMIRVAVSKNATWYRRFCASYASSRRRKNLAFDTKIKRRNVATTLQTLIRCGYSRSQYAAHLVHIARRTAVEMPAEFAA